MRHFLSRATVERARVQLVQWTLFWRFVVEKGGFKAVFPAVEHMSIGDDQGGFDPARRADLRWERLGTITGIEHASTLLAKALALSPVANVCVGACSIPSPMTPNRAILMARQADGKKCNLTVHIQTPPRPGEHQDDPLIKCPPFLVDGITTWECNTMTCGGDWVQMAIKFVSDAMGNAISLRKDIDRGRLAQRPLDIRIFLPRINMSTARPNFPGMPNMDQMDSFGLMMMSMGMQAQMNLAPGDMLGDALRVLSDRMVHLYTSSGVSNMKKVDMLDIDLGPA